MRPDLPDPVQVRAMFLLSKVGNRSCFLLSKRQKNFRSFSATVASIGRDAIEKQQRASPAIALGLHALELGNATIMMNVSHVWYGSGFG